MWKIELLLRIIIQLLLWSEICKGIILECKFIWERKFYAKEMCIRDRRWEHRAFWCQVPMLPTTISFIMPVYWSIIRRLSCWRKRIWMRQHYQKQLIRSCRMICFALPCAVLHWRLENRMRVRIFWTGAMKWKGEHKWI